MEISKGHNDNLNTLIKAARNEDLVLMDCQDKATGKPVVVLCAVGRENGEYVMSPFAKMFDGNPYEELNPPDPDEPGKYIGEVAKVTLTTDDYIHACQAMEKYGKTLDHSGHYASYLGDAYTHLAHAYYHADLGNQRLMRQEFDATFRKFHAMYELTKGAR